MLASTWPMKAPIQVTPTISHGYERQRVKSATGGGSAPWRIRSLTRKAGAEPKSSALIRPPPYARTGSRHMDGGPAQKSSAQRRNHTLDRGPGALMSKSPSLDRLFADGVLEKSIQHAVDGE